MNGNKKMKEDLRDQKLIVSLLQNSLDTDASKTTTLIEPEAKVSVKRIKTVIHPGQSTNTFSKSQVGVVEKKTCLLLTADPLF